MVKLFAYPHQLRCFFKLEIRRLIINVGIGRKQCLRRELSPRLIQRLQGLRLLLKRQLRAMAAASLVFKQSDPKYSSTLLKHAKQLFGFADNHRGSYSVNIPKVQSYYNSTGYGDELLWAASWLYHATEDKTYLDFVSKNGDEFGNFGSPSWFSWDNKLPGTQVTSYKIMDHILLSRLTFFKKDLSGSKGLQGYKETAEAVMCGLIPSSPTATSSRTEGGLIWVAEWNALQQPVSSSFLATLYSDYMLTSGIENLACGDTSFKPSDLRKFARSQVH
ncbi:hypothetical protein YC2023_070660 [Brassica napus]